MYSTYQLHCSVTFSSFPHNVHFFLVTNCFSLGGLGSMELSEGGIHPGSITTVSLSIAFHLCVGLTSCSKRARSEGHCCWLKC